MEPPSLRHGQACMKRLSQAITQLCAHLCTSACTAQAIKTCRSWRHSREQWTFTTLGTILTTPVPDDVYLTSITCWGRYAGYIYVWRSWRERQENSISDIQAPQFPRTEKSLIYHIGSSLFADWSLLVRRVPCTLGGPRLVSMIVCLAYGFPC